MKALGIVLIVLGIVALAYGGITWTDRDTIIDAGPLQVQSVEREGIPLSPILGIVSVAAGIALVFAGGRGRAGA
jgi:uncharacterized membrane protein YidH (DUF202 family)